MDDDATAYRLQLEQLLNVLAAKNSCSIILLLFLGALTGEAVALKQHQEEWKNSPKAPEDSTVKRAV